MIILLYQKISYKDQSNKEYDKDIISSQEEDENEFNDIFMPQRSIEFQINKKNFNYSVNGPKFFKNNKSILNISENNDTSFGIR